MKRHCGEGYEFRTVRLGPGREPQAKEWKMRDTVQERGRRMLELRLTVAAPVGVDGPDVADWVRWRLFGGECDRGVAEILDERGRLVYVSAEGEAL